MPAKKNLELHHGDCIDELRKIPSCSVDAIVTDPPYGLSFMGKRWDYDVPATEVWAECLRVLKPGGHLLAFAGTRTQHRMAVRIEDAGFEIRDMIAWVYGSGFPKSHNLKDDWQGWGTALKPALEPITVARKPLIGTVAENVLAHGTGAINVDGCRVGMEAGDGWNVPQPDTNKINPARSGAANASQTYGRRDDGARAVPHTAGRWPANLIHDGSDEVVREFPVTTSGKAGSEGHKRNSSLHDTNAGWGMRHDTDAGRLYGDTGSAARFFYCAKASKRDRDEGLSEFTVTGRHAQTGLEVESTRTPKNTHPTVKPTDLMRYLCRLVTPPGGVVLDPFMGSGSTGKAAVLEGFAFIGIELEAEYLEIARARIEAAAVVNAPASSVEDMNLNLFS